MPSCLSVAVSIIGVKLCSLDDTGIGGSCMSFGKCSNSVLFEAILKKESFVVSLRLMSI